MRDFARVLLASGETDFETVFRRIQEVTNDPSLAVAGEPPASFTFSGLEIILPAMACEYMWRDLIAFEVLRATQGDADVVAELGSGWSANLFTLWLRGAPKRALYVGGEFTQAGREAAAMVARTRPSMRYLAAAFDWNRPDFSFIPREAKHVTVYSCYSIEQVPQLKPACLRELLARTAGAQTVQGVFVEPVGFQFAELCPNPELIEPTRNYAREMNYNLNLRQVVETLVDEKRIEVTSVAFDAFGQKVNPATVIHWRRL